jgi:hypothetical protein
MSDWTPVTARFEILGHGEDAVVLQVDEDGLPYTPEPLMFNGKPVEITCEKPTLTIYTEESGGV